MIEYLDRPVAFHRAFVKLGVGVTGALMLSQALYWQNRTNSSGWFYKTQQEWEEETGLTRRELDTARKRLRDLGILLEKKQGVPCRVFYQISEPNLIGALEQTSLAESAKQCCTNPPGSAAQIRQTKTETTHRLPETTTKDLCAGAAEIESCFEQFWKVFPTKKGKKQALSKFKSIVKGRCESVQDFAAMLCRDVTQRVQNRQFGFDKLHPTTYLNQERWNDEHESNPTGAGTSNGANRYDQHNARLLAEFGNTATPAGRAGSPPEPGSVDPNQVCGGLRGEVAAPGTTIDLDSGDFHHVGS
ncbi:TPA: hypothetical protein ACGUPM_002677 [Vibrio vulnificus]